MVLQTIASIQSLTISVEIRIKEIQETYNVLEEHQLKVIENMYPIIEGGDRKYESAAHTIFD